MRRLLALVVLLSSCATSPPTPEPEIRVSKVSKLGLFQVDQESCEKEAGKAAKACRSYVYSFELKCQVDLLRNEVPFVGKRVIAFIDKTEVARTESDENGRVALIFEVPGDDHFSSLLLVIAGEYVRVNPKVATSVTMPMRFCEYQRSNLRAK